MAKLELATPDMFQEIADFLVETDVPEAEKEHYINKFYRPIFNYQWLREEKHVGYVLKEEDKVVGFIGAYFSERIIKGEKRNFCSLSTWKVNKNYRSQSLALLFPFIKLQDHIVTALSLAEKVFKVYSKLGFKVLETKAKIIPTFLSLGFPGKTIYLDPKELLGTLNEKDLKIYEDHLRYGCRFGLIKYSKTYCFIVFSKTQKKGINGALIHYISDKALFYNYLGCFKSFLFRKYFYWFLSVDHRFIEGQKYFLALNYTLPEPRVYRGRDILLEDIDSLYSEVVTASIFENNLR